ncbi:MAG TPA: cupin domain-containing protein [Desulfosporosinus sp.]|nr:cupin domain-containing protein [Desulfosporosinus sp.]
MNKAAFLDVNNSIIHNDRSKLGGNFYILSYDDVEWIDGAIEAQKKLYDMGYMVFWVTMQNCINEGKISRVDCENIFDQMSDYINVKDDIITDYRVCISREDSQAKIDAKKIAVWNLARRYDIDLQASFGVGDAKSDILAFKGAGVGTNIHIDLPDTTAKNDHNVEEADGIAPNLQTAVQWFLSEGYNPKSLFTNYVNKVTGREYILCNDANFNKCFKLLQIFKGRVSSYHYHKSKSESFTVVSGKVRFVIDDEVVIRSLGDTIRVTKETPHSFEALSDMAVLFEQSTEHNDDDTYRLTQSGVGDAL